MQRLFQMSGKFRTEWFKLHIFQFFCHEAGFFHIAVLNSPELDILHGDFQDVVSLEEQFFICSVSVVCFSLLPVKHCLMYFPERIFPRKIAEIFFRLLIPFISVIISIQRICRPFSYFFVLAFQCGLIPFSDCSVVFFRLFRSRKFAENTPCVHDHGQLSGKPFAVGIPGDLFLYELKNILIAFFFPEFFIYFPHDLIDLFLRNIFLKGQENVRGDLQKAGDRRQHGDVGE